MVELGVIKMTNTEWLCRGCESDIAKMIKVQELIPPRVSETGHVIPGVPASVYFKDGVCEKCGVSTLVFEYEKAPEEAEAPLEEVIEEAVAEIPQKTVEEVIEEIEVEEDTKQAEIERLKAQIAELEK